MLFSIVLSLRIGHSENALSTAGGNAKKFNFKGVSSSSSQRNNTSAKSGFDYKCAKKDGGREGGSLSACPSLSIAATSPSTDFIFLYTPCRLESLITCANRLL